MYTCLTAETPQEYADRMIASYSEAARMAYSPFIVGWYARECVRLGRYAFEKRCESVVTEAFLSVGFEKVA